ncbi:sugar phosphate isomerase/epimerase [Paenibacillus taihuensis]|uniref:Sugar phosphate isomerase/epimerase n=1 Tax=Paenibacillus taihuensis TaxID=1156355 RepID=A0A3D9S5H4_9BACL|nr:sugar phosphate isomerase/epimerase [Paenibacillus taihuensis]REE85164.1 sugar phosphate isomerase/epimerase [Paenibacillus taihuensis]
MRISAGINVFSVHKELGEDYFGTLEKLAAAGYENLELIGFNMKSFTRFIDEVPAEVVGAKLRELGLTAISVHEGLMPGQDLAAFDWDRVLEYYETFECRNIVLPSVFIRNREDTLRSAEQMNAVGKKLKERGFQFYLHNHAHEFKSVGDTTLFDLLLENTDPSYLKFELDMVWVLRAGLDPIDVLKKLGERCDIVHQKDISRTLAGPLNIIEAMRQNGDEDMEAFQAYGKYTAPSDFVDLGTGAFDLKGTYASIQEMGHIRYALVENEGESADKLQSVRSDLQVLKQYLQASQPV